MICSLVWFTATLFGDTHKFPSVKFFSGLGLARPTVVGHHARKASPWSPQRVALTTVAHFEILLNVALRA